MWQYRFGMPINVSGRMAASFCHAGNDPLNGNVEGWFVVFSRRMNQFFPVD
jgi:hypothetical protein